MRCVVLLAVGLTRRRGRGLVRVTQILGGSLSGVSKPKKKPSLQVANLESNSPGSRMIAPDGLADMQAARRTRFWTKPPRGGPRSGGESLACSGRVRGAALQESPRLRWTRTFRVRVLASWSRDFLLQSNLHLFFMSIDGF